MTGRLVFTDLETMGISPLSHVVEIAMVICESNLDIVAQKSEVVHWDERDWRSANDFAREMHTKSGLMAESLAAPHFARSIWHVEKKFIDWLQENGFQRGDAVIAGNSIGQDRVWMATQMLSMHEFLNHRVVDVSSIRQLIHRWVDPQYTGPSGNNEAQHRALADALWSRRELLEYQRALFVDPATIVERLAR